jgi:hypothetical protein
MMGERRNEADATPPPDEDLADDLLAFACQLDVIELLLRAPASSVHARHDELVAATEMVDWIHASLPAVAGSDDGLDRALRRGKDALRELIPPTADPDRAHAVLRASLANARQLLTIAAAVVR